MPRNARPASLQNIAFDSGRIHERTRMIRLIKSRICFDRSTYGKCEHAACYGYMNLIKEIEREQNA